MKRSKNASFYSHLRCPYCQEPLQVLKIWQYLDEDRPRLRPETHPQARHIKYGILECLCDQYPIVEGIVYLKKDGAQTNQQAVSWLNQRNWAAAFNCLIAERKKIKWIYQGVWHIPPQSWVGQRLQLSHVLTLFYWLVDSGSKAWYRYLKTRHHRVTFLMTLAPLALAQSTTMLVDAGCGLGHFLRYAAQWTTAQQLVGLDIAFSFLYLARRFMVTPDTYLICCDQEAGLPFTDHSVSTYYINDAFVVIKTKRAVLQELTRVVSPQGRAIISHVHNRFVQNLGQEYGVTLSEMDRYSPHGQLWASSDRDLWAAAYQRQVVTYTPVEILNRRKWRVAPPAFSFLWTPRRSRQLHYPVLLSWQELVAATPIDYSEDEHLLL